MNEYELIELYPSLMKYKTYFHSKYNSIDIDEIESELNYSIAIAYDRYDAKQKTKFSTLVFTIMHNQCKMIIRKQSIRTHINTKLSLDNSIQDNKESFYNLHSDYDYFNDNARMFVDYLNTFALYLSESQARVFNLYLKGYTNMEIVDKLSVTHTTVTSIRDRIIMKLLPIIEVDFPFMLNYRCVNNRLSYLLRNVSKRI